MKSLYVIDEAYPLYKIGGLGDIGGTLPKELDKLGVDISLVLPKHPNIITDNSWSVSAGFDIIYDSKSLSVLVYKGVLPGTNIDTFLIEENTYISQKTDESDNHADKFAVFSLALCHWIKQLEADKKPDLIHLNDWHTALIPIINKHLLGENKYKYLITIHNLMYQGVTNTPIIEKLGISPDCCQIIELDRQDHSINILLEGLLHADAINAVSPQYAKDILTSEYGEKIDELLSLRKKDIVGILNGIDIDIFNPSTDPLIFKNYSIDNFAEGKAENKQKLQEELGLEQNNQAILIGFVGRIDSRQKGVQLIIEAISKQHIANENQQFVFLGTGDPELERQIHQVSDKKYNIRIITRYDETLARKLYAATDMLLIPSKFEPCGLIQMIANRYGTIPVARETGGLKDTIVNQENGFLFKEYSSDAMIESLNQAILAMKDNDIKNKLIISAMSHDFSWDKTASEYLSLYNSIFC